MALRLLSGPPVSLNHALKRDCLQPRTEFALGNIDLRIGAGVPHQTGETPTIEIVTSLTARSRTVRAATFRLRQR
jgi:hypothetical protein